MRRVYREYIIIGIVAGVTWAVAEVSIRTNWLRSLENGYSDLWHHLAEVRAQPEHVAIVAIDDETLLEHKDEPLVFWGPHFAKAIDVLREAGVSVIGVDFLFLVSAESWMRKLELPENDMGRSYDIPMRSQLAQGQVVLAGLLTVNKRGEGEYLLPLQDYIIVLPDQLASVGLINMYTDTDGVIRHFVPAVFQDDKVDRLPRLTFSTLLAVKAARLNPQSTTWSLGSIDVPNTYDIRRIGFSGPPQSIPRISFSQLLRPQAKTDPNVRSLQDRVVIIAPEYAGMSDIHLTPYARPFLGFAGHTMSGAEIHANIVETLLSGRFPRPIASWLRALYLAAILLFTTFLFFKVSPWKGVGIGLLGGIICAILGYLLFCYNTILPVANVQLALLLSYLGTLGFRLTGEERERERLRHMFGRFVSNRVVEHLVDTGTSPNLGGESCQVTILFSDIRDFTTISERLNPGEVVEILNAYFSRVCEPILEQGGTVDKFIGDAVMAIFGAPALFPDHCERALQAALAMKAIAEDFQTWIQARFPYLPPFRIGIGVHTGEAVVGNIGSSKRMEYTAIGDTVNTASRLEGLSKTLGWTIVASADTLNAAGSKVLTGGHDEIQVKGRAKPVKVFEIIGFRLNAPERREAS